MRKKPILLLGLTAWWALSSAAAPLNIDYAQSRIEVAVNSTLSSFTARLERYDAEIDCEPSAPLPTRAVLSFDFRDLKTGAKGRDEHMLKWLQYLKTPAGSFRLQTWKEQAGQSIAVGDLTIHGVTQEIRMPVTVKHQDSRYEIHGAVVLDYREFGLPVIRQAALLTVKPHLKITFHLSGK